MTQLLHYLKCSGLGLVNSGGKIRQWSSGRILLKVEQIVLKVKWRVKVKEIVGIDVKNCRFTEGVLHYIVFI